MALAQPANVAACLYVGNVPLEDDGTATYRVLCEGGNLLRLMLPPDSMSRAHRGFAYAEYDSPATAANAQRLLSGRRVFSRPLRLDWVTNASAVSILNGTSPPGVYGPPRVITGPPTAPVVTMAQTVGGGTARGPMPSAASFGGGRVGAYGAGAGVAYGRGGGHAGAGFASRPYAGGGGYGGAALSSSGASAAGGPGGVGAGAMGALASSVGVGGGGLGSVRGAVEGLSHEELVSIGNEVRALAASDPLGTRALLLQYPSLTAALLMIEERLGMLHTATETLQQRAAAQQAAAAEAAAAAAEAAAAAQASAGAGASASSSAGMHLDSSSGGGGGWPGAGPAAGSSSLSAAAPPASSSASTAADALGLSEMSREDGAALIGAVLEMDEAQVAAADPEQQDTIRAVKDSLRLSAAEIGALPPAKREELLGLREQLRLFGLEAAR